MDKISEIILASRENWVDELKGILILRIILGNSIMSVNVNDMMQKNYFDLNLHIPYTYVFCIVKLCTLRLRTIQIS